MATASQGFGIEPGDMVVAELVKIGVKVALVHSSR